MILSVSRRTDIPAFYGDWFYQRIREGFVEVRNPVNQRQISRIILSPEVVECIVFWTKNPSQRFMEKLRLLDTLGYLYYFQFTLTAYDALIERTVPDKKLVLQTFRELSEKIGKEKVIWRYDPIFISERYTIAQHVRSFEYLASELSGYTDTCIISFIDMYRHIGNQLAAENIRELSADQMNEIGRSFSVLAEKYNFKLETCCESIDLDRFGIEHGHCIDGRLINRLTGRQFLFKKDKTQRKECGCCTSIDIGAYNTCLHNCIYCYANRGACSVEKNSNCNPASPLLCSELQSSDKLTDRNIPRCLSAAPELF
jgi:hypothetical protein